MGKFGWDLPPGVTTSMLPGNGPVAPCDVCGRDPERDQETGGCICPECTVCLEVGRLDCYTEHGLVRTQEQIDGRTAMDAQIRAEVEAENAYFAQLPSDSEGDN